jgi:hypothetical protein
VIRIVGKILLFVFLLAILTVVTQVGGIILLLTMGIVSILRKRLKSVWSQYISAFLIFTCLYISGTFFIIPWIAKPFGRVPLPLQGKVKPLTIGTVLLNRHYVRPALRDVVMQASLAIEKKHTGSIVITLMVVSHSTMDFHCFHISVTMTDVSWISLFSTRM